MIYGLSKFAKFQKFANICPPPFQLKYGVIFLKWKKKGGPRLGDSHNGDNRMMYRYYWKLTNGIMISLDI